MHIYIYIYIHIYVCMYVCMHIYIYIYEVLQAKDSRGGPPQELIFYKFTAFTLQ